MQNQNFYDLTNPQKSIWDIEQFYKKTSINNIGGTLIINNTVNFDLLNLAINKAIELNDSFNIKLSFNDEGIIKQFFDNTKYKNLEIISLNSYDELTNKEKDLISIPFSLLNASLYNFTMFKFPNGTGGLIMIIHHLISDAFSCNLIANQIASIYNSLISNNAVLKEKYSYKNYIEFELEYIKSSKFEKDKKFWNTFLDNVPEPVSLSISNDKELGTFEKIESSRQSYIIDEELLNRIKSFCLDNKVSLYNFFMAIYSLYIGKVNNINDLIIGTPILNRTGITQKNTTGMFINTIPFRCSFDESDTFKSYVKNIASNSLTMIRHQKYSYQYILDDIRKKNINFPNLYTILLSYQIGKSKSDETNFDYSVRWTHASTNSDELDIHIFEYDDNNNTLNIAYDYQNKKFTFEDINKLHFRICYIIEQVLYNNLKKLSDIKLIIPDEQDFIINYYNSCNTQLINKSIVELFEEQVDKTPYNIAISSNGYDINYVDFNNIINYVAHNLKNYGITPNDNICLFFNNSIELVVCIYALLKLSACYIPIDTNYPSDRIKYIINNSNSKFILTNISNIEKINLVTNKTITLNLQTIISDYRNHLYSNFENKPKLDSNAYIIYTSGSTGNPKGVQICHKSLANYILWAKDTYVKNDIANFPLYSSIAFDLTVTTIFTPLISGNTLYIYENQNPELLLQEIFNDRKVQILKLTPAHMFLLQDIITEKPAINKLIVGGDILTTEGSKKITELFGNDVQIFNEYGPTEATVGCMTYIYTKKDEKKYASVPIGTPASNTKIYLLNDDLNFVPFGYNAQIYISGLCLSKGYLNLPKKTKEKFISSPFFKDETLYSSGDVAKLYDNGIMEYIGRQDFQVKINGFRIETGEIQSKMLSYEAIKDCFVNVINFENAKTLCAYYVSETNVNLNDLKNFLMSCLPKYMIPKFFIKLPNIPLTFNGKINKLQLPLPQKNINVEYVSPSNNLEEIIHNTIAKVLKIDKISVLQNIFDLSVDSLTIIKIQTKLYSLGISIDTQAFYNYPTIRDLSNYIEHKSSEPLSSLSDAQNIKLSDIIVPYNKALQLKNILLFGVTGFLGIHILHELLEFTNSHIYCIIREKDRINSIERFKQKYSFYYDDIDDILDRITPITGDLYCENLGLLDQTYKELSENIDCVFSSAAIVKHFGDPETFHKTNVLGTRRIINFCLTNKIPFHYVSTLSICGKGLTNITSEKKLFKESDFFIGQNYNDNIYVKSKFQAESIIIKACKEEGLIASIYRIGNLTNRYTDGIFQENAAENAFLNRLASIINLNCMPKELLNYQIDFTPVDYCAKFIVALSKKMSNNLNIYHLFNNNYLTYQNFYDILIKNGYDLTLLPLDEFSEKVLTSNLNSFGITNYLSSLETNTIEIDNNYTNEFLKTLNLSWPKINDSYINKILNYLKEYNFIGDSDETKEE